MHGICSAVSGHKNCFVSPMLPIIEWGACLASAFVDHLLATCSAATLACMDEEWKVVIDEPAGSSITNLRQCD